MTGGNSAFYTKTDAVPPMAVAARALALLMENAAMPAGTIHVNQDLKFLAEARSGEKLTSTARLLRKQERAGMRLMTIGFTVSHKTEDVLNAKTTFILPPG